MLMKIHDVAQGEAEWAILRLGKVTASECDQILTPELKERTGEMPKTYLAKKVAEAWRGQPLPGFTAFATEQGQMLEDEARSWYAFAFDSEKIKNVGFIEHDDGRCGCSPDALLNDDSGLELKCPEPHTHVKYLLSGELPKDYACQVNFSLYVSGRPRWKFVSYRRKFPALIVTVERDESIMAKIQAALTKFYTAFDEAMARLKELNA